MKFRYQGSLEGVKSLYGAATDVFGFMVAMGVIVVICEILAWLTDFRW